uniref:Uncharacterized protein n=1 Tax=Oryza brachyantha TaxID=4533 RepID=J3MX78_ORYBR
MDDLLECKRQIEKSNAAGTSRDEGISEHENEEDEHLKMKSTFDKLCLCLDKQERLVQEIEVLMEDDKKYVQAQQFMVAIPSFICIGLILDRMRILVDSNILYICFLPATFYFSNCPHSSHHLPLTQYMVEKKCTIDKNNTHIIWITRYNTLVSC